MVLVMLFTLKINLDLFNIYWSNFVIMWQVPQLDAQVSARCCAAYLLLWRK